jgi:hypothetical protein
LTSTVSNSTLLQVFLVIGGGMGQDLVNLNQQPIGGESLGKGSPPNKK